MCCNTKNWHCLLDDFLYNVSVSVNKQASKNTLLLHAQFAGAGFCDQIGHRITDAIGCMMPNPEPAAARDYGMAGYSGKGYTTTT